MREVFSCTPIWLLIPLHCTSLHSHGAYELCFCDRANWEGCFGQLYNGRTGTPERPMHRSQQPIRIGYTKLVIELVITIYGPSCTFLELIFPCNKSTRSGWYLHCQSMDYVICIYVYYIHASPALKGTKLVSQSSADFQVKSMMSNSMKKKKP